jgi:hypothetical protein
MRHLAILALLSAGWAAAAQAQTSDPYRNPWARTGPIGLNADAGPKDARAVLRRFAKCTATYHHDAARRFLLMPLGSWVPQPDYRQIADPHCLSFVSGRLRIGQLAYRGALAEELVRRDFAHAGPLDARGLPPLDWTVPQPSATDPRTQQRIESARDVAIAETVLGELGECLVREAPVGSLALLKTTTADTETAAFEAIRPQIAGCIQKGNSLTFTRTNLRSAIALSYYRLASASLASGQQESAK